MSVIKLNNSIIIYVGCKAYDVTSFIEKHPGGIRAILNKCCQDVTRDYKWHSDENQQLWEHYRAPIYDKPSLKKECAIL